MNNYKELSNQLIDKIIEVLGAPNQAGVDMLSLIKEYDVVRRFLLNNKNFYLE